MGISWSKMRNALEHDNICDSLKGRVRYFATRCRHSHDSEGCVAILIDGNEVFTSCYFDWCSYHGKGYTSAIDNGAFDQYFFYRAYYTYANQSIEDSLNSEDAIVRLFAILDKRASNC